ncbi:hypothetical protein AAC387_Pa01g2595 [Persea americana]
MKEEEEKEDDEANALWDCGSPLYDSFELTSLYNLLDRKLMALPFPGGTSSSRSGEVGVSGDSRGQSKVVVLDGFVGGNMRKKRKADGGWMKGCKVKKMKTRLHAFCSTLAFWRK